MTIERRRPLPIGRYWADIFPAQRPAWSAWISVQTAAGHARLVTTSHTDAMAGAEEHDWVLWTTSAETVWPDETMGFAPTVAGPEITQESDTVQRPEPEPDPIDAAANAAKTAADKLAGAVTTGIVILASALAATLIITALRRRGQH